MRRYLRSDMSLFPFCFVLFFEFSKLRQLRLFVFLILVKCVTIVVRLSLHNSFRLVKLYARISRGFIVMLYHVLHVSLLFQLFGGRGALSLVIFVVFHRSLFCYFYLHLPLHVLQILIISLVSSKFNEPIGI